jgi:hypothetical protein
MIWQSISRLGPLWHVARMDTMSYAQRSIHDHTHRTTSTLYAGLSLYRATRCFRAGRSIHAISPLRSHGAKSRAYRREEVVFTRRVSVKPLHAMFPSLMAVSLVTLDMTRYGKPCVHFAVRDWNGGPCSTRIFSCMMCAGHARSSKLQARSRTAIHVV